MENYYSRIEIFVLADDYAGMTKGFLAQHGVSYFIRLHRDQGEKTSILFDTGYDGKAVLHNMKLLGLDINEVDYIVLSHNHYDHSNGLLYLLEKRTKKTAIPVIVGRGFFEKTIALKPRMRILNPDWSRNQGESLGTWFIETSEKLEIMPGVSVPGIIKYDERLEFEKEAPEYYIVDGNGFKRDFLEHEIALVIESSRGLLVFTGCSHPGVASIVEKVVNLYGRKVYSVIGGMHLINADELRIKRTIQKLRELGVAKVFAGHCTGLKAEKAFLEVYGDDFVRIHTALQISI
jgi:7,8-dihydropterin-6-yl-methyl-4-(beta-D-ribofuranosyl)aminobenzene 5'-phosphate synthase